MPGLTFANLAWTSAPMPGSSGPVELARLPDLGDGAFRAFVRFPAGWQRPIPGHYTLAEEFLVLEGDLRINGRCWDAGGYAWIPARRMRSDTRSVAGCLAFAWFAGPPPWRSGQPALPCDGQETAFDHWRHAPSPDMRGADRLHELRRGAEHVTMIIDSRAPRLTAWPGDCVECLDLADYAWSAAQGVPHLAGPCLIRIPPSRSTP